ncbi:MAG: hypothetical protein AAF517_06885 [Planctomycetota bacterium]
MNNVVILLKRGVKASANLFLVYVSLGPLAFVSWAFQSFQTKFNDPPIYLILPILLVALTLILLWLGLVVPYVVGIVWRKAEIFPPNSRDRSRRDLTSLG